MSVSKKFATKQVNRMAGLNYFPSEDSSVEELVDALVEADSETMAAAVVTEWIRRETDRPSPADLLRLIESHRNANRYWKPPIQPAYRCPRCQDSGICEAEVNIGPWIWCDCPASPIAILREPEAVAKSNAALQKLLDRFGPKPSTA